MSRPPRRGVLLLVVLSMLVLFMLIGTAFLMSSGQHKKAAVYASKSARVGNLATKKLDGALLQILRDTDNPYSVVRYHSLLRDLYGTEGFQGVAYSPVTMDLATAPGQATRFAGATAAQQLGPTQGQFVDFYVRALGWDSATNASLDDPSTPGTESTGADKLLTPDLRHVVKLDRNPYGQPQLHPLPLTKGYYNGCLLTITSGPASGQTARVVDYEYIGDLDQTSSTPPAFTRLFRFRVMTFQRADGQPLQINPSRPPEIGDLAGATFIVNGRAFGGTGVGYNPLAATGQARLSAVELFRTSATEALGAEVALLPNATYLNLSTIGSSNAATNQLDDDGDGLIDEPDEANPFLKPFAISTFTALNTAAAQQYSSFAGPGGVNEPYDAADFQNMFLALQTVTPRARGRVMHSDFPNPLDVNDPAVWNGTTFVNMDKFLRLDLEDLPLPSFHRPDLVNFWYHRLLGTLTNPNGPFAMQPDEATLAILDPYPNGVLRTGLNPGAAALIMAIKRQSSLRPLHEDHPKFDGSNPLSVPKGLPTSGLVDPTSMTNIAIPYWEAVGPWDVDNDNDGVPDSIWVDLGEPIQEAEDGTRYKPLYAFLIIDLDSRLNVNAHGLADDINPPSLALSYDPNTGAPMTGAAAINLAGKFNSNILAQGLGYGPAEISLRPVFPAPLDIAGVPIPGNRSEVVGPVDSYAAELIGRQKLDGTSVPGKYGYEPAGVTRPQDAVTPGINYRYDNSTPYDRLPDLAAQIKFFDYPLNINYRTSFGTPPDLFSRYATGGLDYTGQPVYEVLNDVNANTPASPIPNRPLLSDSPYELDLSRVQRRDTWAASFANSNLAFQQSLNQNDDAAFSPTDLEKVLRAWDADSGTLPSRLWDCVNDFDPLKLMDFDPYRVQAASQAAFNSASPPELLATAQQIAGINRRLVTTDSYDLPVAGGTIPNPSLIAMGPDGQPGRAGVDDDNLNGIDNAAELNAPISDDFRSLFGKEVAQATIFDLMRYRVWQQVRAYVMVKNNETEATLAAKNATDYATFLTLVSQLTDNRLNGEPGVDIDGNGAIDPPIGQLLAPEVVAGIRMDVNRPFGDGLDNNNDGVVDDPLEAGEPFLDASGNGKWDNGEPFIDILAGDADNDGNIYDGPRDQLWAGLTGEPIGFDYTNGQAVFIHKVAFPNVVIGGVRNLESQGLQFYARQLYCLMLLLVDENYIAPWDENDPQIMTWIESEKAKLTAAPLSLPAAQADLIVKRKLTCRTIAQWAINCVDMRDPDVIMTPFEYDENPWDGWGCPDGTVVGGPPNPINVPLDGDPATDENKGEIIDWDAVKTSGKKTLKVVANLPTLLNQTRGVVWGAERPELLITETLAFHDRRTEDLLSNDPNGHGEMKHYTTYRAPGGPGGGNYQDPDPDQGLRPRGSLFVEVYNPWSPDGQYPAELYSRVNSSLAAADPNRVVISNGVQLDRVSNFAVDANGNLSLAPSDAAAGIKRSPVWRMIVVEEWPDSRNSDDIDEKRLDRVASSSEPQSYKDMTTRVKNWTLTTATPVPPFRPADPDFDAAFDAGFLPTQKGMGKNLFSVQYPYVEREFYFTTDKSPAVPASSLTLSKDQSPDYDYAPAKFKLRIPYRTVDIKYPTAGLNFKPGYIQRFIPEQLETDTSIPATQSVIAPILPGRYGVIGSAGAKYTAADQTYTTTIGRFDVGTSSWNTDDTMHNPIETRRIELRPSNDPSKQQIVVATNGGDPKDVNNPSLDSMGNKQYDPTTKEIGRDNELISDQGTVKNIYLKADGTPGSDFYQPCVTIPVEGMSISEPAWGWAPREFEAAQEEATINGGSPKYFQFKPSPANKNEGRYFGGAGSTNKTSYDKPFDGYDKHQIAPELIRNGTTANYRTIHLQRLANPALPWNPYPGQFKDQAGNYLYRPNLPINPYRTVDTASVNLTAVNGTTSAEANYPIPGTQDKLLQWRPWETSEVLEYLKKYSVDWQVWHFRSTERGAWARLNMLGAAASPATSPPQRVLWSQEPAMVKFKTPGYTDLFSLINIRQMTMRATEVDLGVTPPPGVGSMTKINRADMVMEHTLGFGNKSFGLLYDKRGAKQPNTPVGSLSSSAAPSAAAVGTPAPGDYVWDLDSKNPAVDARITVNSTNPWLEWGNRPYVSGEELLNVPAGSQATMLRLFSAGATANPYDGTGLDAMGNPVPSMTRLANLRSPFGHLLNASLTDVLPARIFKDAMGNPVLDANGNIQYVGAPNFYRILDYVQVPSRFVGTDTMLNAETFNDVPVSATYPAEPIGTDISGPNDPRYYFQPPFNKVSRERDPGRVNLNTVTGRRAGSQIWSDVFDGIMHRFHDANLSASQLGHLGPAWRDIVLSRRGYAQANAGATVLPNGIGSVDKVANGAPPDVFAFGLNPKFPTFFANPFRSPDGGDLVPLQWMMHYGVDASWMRRHHYNRGGRGNWGQTNIDDNGDGTVDDTREAGFGGDDLVVDMGTGQLLPVASTFPTAKSGIPLLSESFNAPYYDGNRNPYMYYQPMTRLGNLVTDRSGVFGVWITVGYFEVEKAPDWSSNENGVQGRFGGDISLYNRAYPDGYMLGRELGSDTGDVKRPRGFYIIDRTEEVGFKPGEDLNVEKLIRLRRRIE